ncbi:MAG: hypothetical protein A3E00_06295 [Curvibacter sp. RIFCSPHIGHO2_12_FULL_63_18]|nr:MAG: hypothetical protein A2037_01160 [Curvibacter sp. GWA2_63_95]OGO98739.1 MAG: hypothetical protein A3E00_06295 [Curvibacter sp. RIFCSPHIGHO2_12_FULL_63_18]
MRHVVAVWAQRNKMLYRIKLVFRTQGRNWNRVMNMDLLLAQNTKRFLEVEAASFAVVAVMF